MMDKLSTGRPSWTNRIEKLAVEPPGTGGVEHDRITHMRSSMMSQDDETAMPLLSATLRAAK